jgi:hypothetical protein
MPAIFLGLEIFWPKDLGNDSDLYQRKWLLPGSADLDGKRS